MRAAKIISFPSIKGGTVPTQNAESADSVFHFGFQLQGHRFTMKEIKRPAPVLMAALDHYFDSFLNAAAGLDSGIAEIPAINLHAPINETQEVSSILSQEFVTQIRSSFFHAKTQSTQRTQTKHLGELCVKTLRFLPQTSETGH